MYDKTWTCQFLLMFLTRTQQIKVWVGWRISIWDIPIHQVIQFLFHPSRTQHRQQNTPTGSICDTDHVKQSFRRLKPFGCMGTWHLHRTQEWPPAVLYTVLQLRPKMEKTLVEMHPGVRWEDFVKSFQVHGKGWVRSLWGFLLVGQVRRVEACKPAVDLNEGFCFGFYLLGNSTMLTLRFWSLWNSKLLRRVSQLCFFLFYHLFSLWPYKCLLYFYRD